MKDKRNITMAICYDFDGTLAPGNMQEHNFIPEQLEIKKEDFWKIVKENAKKHDMDEILSYLEITLKKAKERGNVEFTKKAFQKYGKNITFFKGVESWFKRVNKYANNKSIEIEHYIISSGIKTMIEGTKIKKYFKHIFACDFKYDANNVAEFPAVAINYTTKTQYLFRINKGILNNYDNSINEYTPDKKRKIPFNRIIYIGDGLTDVPAMKMTNYKKGYSIGVYDPDDKKSAKETCKKLLENKRCSFIAPANYEENQNLDKIVNFIIDKICIENEMDKYK